MITGPHSNALGCYRLPEGYIQTDLRWGAETVAAAFAEVEGVGLVIRDASRGWVFLPEFLRWNPIGNPNVGKFVVKLAEAVPPDVSFFHAFVEALRRHGRCLPEGFLKGFETLSQPSRNREREQEREPEREQEREPDEAVPAAEEVVAVVAPPADGHTHPWPSPAALAQLFNRCTPPGHPKVKVAALSPGRQEKARRALQDFPDRAFWEVSFGAVRDSAFLRREGTTPGHAGFIANFDWFLQRGKDGVENCVKAAEGRYQDSAPREGEPPPQAHGSPTAQHNLAVLEEYRRTKLGGASYE
jgi:hypothetical protein